MAVLTRLRGAPEARVLAALCALALAALLAAGCSCSRSAGEGLEGIEWELQGSSASSADFRYYKITARFEDGTVAGHSAVNSYSAVYDVRTGGSLEIGEVTATLMAGTPDAMSAEEIYLTLLRAVRSWGVSNGELELRDADGNPLLIFARGEQSAPPRENPGEDEETAVVEATGAPRPSEGPDMSVAYAQAIGGTPHRGELLYVIVGASYPSEAAASGALNAALPAFGDMQSYFIVQRSDNFAGLARGQWVILEAYRRSPSESNLEFARRAFPEARVQRVTVRTDDPIPVYEDLVGKP